MVVQISSMQGCLLKRGVPKKSKRRSSRLMKAVSLLALPAVNARYDWEMACPNGFMDDMLKAEFGLNQAYQKVKQFCVSGRTRLSAELRNLVSRVYRSSSFTTAKKIVTAPLRSILRRSVSINPKSFPNYNSQVSRWEESLKQLYLPEQQKELLACLDFTSTQVDFDRSKNHSDGRYLEAYAILDALENGKQNNKKWEQTLEILQKPQYSEQLAKIIGLAPLYEQPIFFFKGNAQLLLQRIKSIQKNRPDLSPLMQTIREQIEPMI